MIELPNLAELKSVRHGFLTRHGGVSDGIYDSLNCGLGSKDDPAKVAENRERAVKAAGLPAGSLVTAYQVHSANVAVVDRLWPGGDRPQIDGMVSTTPGISLGILTADCVPVLFADDAARVIGASHAGWRGAVSGILPETVEAMEKLGARRARIHAAIGPCIGAKSYEVGPEFPAPFIAEDPENARFFATASRCRHFMFDLVGYVTRQLNGLGLASVEAAGNDTCAEPDNFFSYRRTTLAKEPDYGRQVSVIGLR
jgi:YfiH family protein